MRLIDADKLLEVFRTLETRSLDGKMYISNAIFAVENALTAYDVDEKVKQLEALKAMLKTTIVDTGDKTLTYAYRHAATMFDTAIEIVKGEYGRNRDERRNKRTRENAGLQK